MHVVVNDRRHDDDAFHSLIAFPLCFQDLSEYLVVVMRKVMQMSFNAIVSTMSPTSMKSDFQDRLGPLQ